MLMQNRGRRNNPVGASGRLICERIKFFASQRALDYFILELSDDVPDLLFLTRRIVRNFGETKVIRGRVAVFE